MPKIKSKKFKVSRPCIQRSLNQIGLKYNNSNKFQQSVENYAREFTDQETFIIVDDEKYFTFSDEETPGNTGFYSSNKENIPNNKSKQKFEPKILVWLSLSSKDNNQRNTDVYIRKCLPKLLKNIILMINI